MARFTHIDDSCALDTQTNVKLQTVTLPVEYAHLRNNELVALEGDTFLMFTPETRLADLRDSAPDTAQQSRRLVVENRRFETGHPFIVVVAIQAAEGSEEYVDCIVDQNG